MNLCRHAFILALTACTLAPAHAQWQWRDAQGRVTWSDRPPPSDVQAKDIISRPTPTAASTAAQRPSPKATSAASVDGGSGAASNSASGASAANTPDAGKPVAAKDAPKDPELDARKRKADEEKDAQRKADEAKRAEAQRENCARARSHMQLIESGSRISRTNAQGEREVLEDAGRADEARRARAIISSDCKG